MLKVLPVLIVVLTIACTEQDAITLHQEHIYKGKPDTLKVDSEVLSARFKQVQQDR